MNKNISRLYAIAGKNERLIIGLMSGTSLDGLDIALCRFKGSGRQTKASLLNFETIAYNKDFKDEIRTIFARQIIQFEKLCLLNGWVARIHAAMILRCLKKWKISPDKIDLIASHGQTVFHTPKSLHKQEKFGNATLQIGDGDQLAVSTGIITISDFRQKHIAAGGEGAPLAVYGDYFLFSKKGEDRIMLNIGGIANFTFLPGKSGTQFIFSTDTGPGNTMMDAFVQKHFGIPFDKHAAIARKGLVNKKLLGHLKKDSFFAARFPKTTGPELFNLAYLEKAIAKARIKKITPEDVMATLNRFSAETIANAILKCVGKKKNVVVYTSGGGMHNPLLMDHIRSFFPNQLFYTTDSLDIDPDAKEALLFAILANESVAGGGLKMGDPKSPSVSMGKISFPC